MLGHDLHLIVVEIRMLREKVDLLPGELKVPRECMPNPLRQVVQLATLVLPREVGLHKLALKLPPWTIPKAPGRSIVHTFMP